MSADRGELQHQKAVWHHDLDDEPYLIFSEVDGNAREIRKIEVFRQAVMTFADASTHTGLTELCTTPLPTLQEINEQPEFTADSISAELFESLWAQARAGLPFEA